MRGAAAIKSRLRSHSARARTRGPRPPLIVTAVAVVGFGLCPLMPIAAGSNRYARACRGRGASQAVTTAARIASALRSSGASLTTILPWNMPAGTCGNIRVVHRHVAFFLDVSHGDIRFEQLRLKGKAASDKERNEVVTPERR